MYLYMWVRFPWQSQTRARFPRECVRLCVWVCECVYCSALPCRAALPHIPPAPNHTRPSPPPCDARRARHLLCTLSVSPRSRKPLIGCGGGGWRALCHFIDPRIDNRPPPHPARSSIKPRASWVWGGGLFCVWYHTDYIPSPFHELSDV